MVWGRYDEAANHLSTAVDAHTSSLVPEPLYWLGVARYLKVRRRVPMMEAGNRLRTEYPNNSWAARVAPNQEDAPEDIG